MRILLCSTPDDDESGPEPSTHDSDDALELDGENLDHEMDT